MKPILAQLGLTPEMIARHVVRVEPPLTGYAVNQLLNGDAKIIAMRKRRTRFIAAGLNSDGKPRRRSPNGTRKPYVRKITSPAS
jgi:hypothetical protein